MRNTTICITTRTGKEPTVQAITTIPITVLTTMRITPTRKAENGTMMTTSTLTNTTTDTPPESGVFTDLTADSTTILTFTQTFTFTIHGPGAPSVPARIFISA